MELNAPTMKNYHRHQWWLNCEDPLVNHHPWTTMEDKNILHIVQQKGIDNWIDKAVSLGTNRTPFQCLARYQRSLNASIMKREWTEAEDNKLRAAVETFGESNWQVVASTLEGRTGTQCSNRWKKSLHPARQRVGKWTPDEDKRLKVAVMLFGPKTWKKIAQFVPGRTQVQCRERWVNCLDPSLNLDEWTEEEDLRLKAAIAEHGYCWSKVAACVPPRTDSQCRRRWKVLLPHEVPLLQAARKIQKAALISNFVDRESDRPALGPNDFIPLPAINSISESEHLNLPGKQKKKSRRKLESRGKDKASGDVSNIRSKRLIREAQICSEEFPGLTNCNEIEKSGGDGTISKKKRVMKPRLQKKKYTDSTVHSSCPDTTLLAITNGEEVGAFGGDNATKKKKNALGRQKRKSRGRPESQEIDPASGDDAISKKRRVTKSYSKESNGCNLVKDHPSSCPDSELLMSTNGEEVQEFGQDAATKNKEASKPCSKKNKCIELVKEVPGITNSNEVKTFGGNDAISKKRRQSTKPHSEKNKQIETLLIIGSGKYVEAFSRNDATKKKRTPKLHFRRNQCTETCEKTAEIINSNGVETFGGDDTISEKRLSMPQSRQDKFTAPTQDHSASCPDSTLYRLTNVDEVAVFGGDGARKKKTAPKPNSRSIYAKLLQEISEITDPDEVETFGDDVAITNKSCVEKNNCTDPSQDYLSSFINSISNEEVGVSGGNNATKKKKAIKQCSRSKCTESLKVSQSLVSFPANLKMGTANGDGIETSGGDNSTLCKKERAPNRHPRRAKCSKQSGELQDHAISSVNVAKLSSKWGATEVVEGSQNIASAPKCSTSNMMDNGNLRTSNVIKQDSLKRSRTREMTCSNQILEIGDEDDMTLACFVHNKLKKRRAKIAKNGNAACYPSGMKGSDVLPKGIGILKDRNRVPSFVLNCETQTSCNYDTLPSQKKRLSHSDDLPTIIANDIDHRKALLVTGGMLAVHEPAKEPVNTDLEGIHEAGDEPSDRSSPPPGFEHLMK
ncbi:hypothetical protein F0562_023935 [Nyssa sinensis]|uniref:Uncharacterized protein n=1 Tax=Nyssa sinensis TaxID=561372 RepID=A0A5J5BHR4_9ASTE|nr:hypothetical protein F0562_023935 [Nyssa sinensis]